MSTGFQELQPHQLTDAIATLLVPKLAAKLRDRAPGHCMRATDLDSSLMLKLATDLRSAVPDALIYILSNGSSTLPNSNLYISSTKLIELRNPQADQTLRPPLLIFLPANLQTNAEDSFNVASFEEVSVANIYDELTQSILKAAPIELQGYVRELLETLSRDNWAWSDSVSKARFLLTAQVNGIDGDTLGASLYELGLVPDFHLFEQPALVQNRILKNKQAVQHLTHDLPHLSIRGRILNLELIDKTLQNRLISLLSATGLENPQDWTRQIVLDRNNWSLEFDKWKRKTEVNAGEIYINILGTDLPVSTASDTDPRLQSIVGSHYLAAKSCKKIKVEFEVNPHPTQVQGLSYFTAQIIAQDGSTIGSLKKIKSWTGRSNKKSVSLEKLDKVEFDEGWHYIRILPWTEEGDPISLAQPKDSTSSFEPSPNTSEDFYVLPDGELEEETPPAKIPEATSLYHAKLQVQFKAISQERDPNEITLKEMLWKDPAKSSDKKSQATLNVKFSRSGHFYISVSSQLKQLEEQILRSPEQLNSWQMTIAPTHIDAPVRIEQLFRSSIALTNFLACRAAYFKAFTDVEEGFIAQSVDWLNLETLCLEYATAYQEWLQSLQAQVERTQAEDAIALQELKQAVGIDTVYLTIKDFRGRAKEALLAGPTHPLRALWFVVWAKISQAWISAAQTNSDTLTSAKDSIQQLIPLNFPAFLPLSDSRIFTTVDNLNPFWSLYASPSEEDTRGLFSQICLSLGLPEPKSMSGAAITGSLLTARIERYLTQHPYIRTFSINAFNPGRASVLADAIMMLQRRELGKNLRYEIRLFVPNPDLPAIADELETLLGMTSEIAAPLTDENADSRTNYLFPKFKLAVLPTQQFQEHPEHYPAHLSFLFDAFPNANIEAISAFRPQDSSPLHGLVQDFVVRFQNDDAGIRWQRQPRHGEATLLPKAENLVEQLASLSQHLSGTTATIATGTLAFAKRPVITLALNAQYRDLIHRIHAVSDWVFTIDRNLGIEFFDQSDKRNRPAYLVDYVPSSAINSGHRLVITSRSLAELESILARVLRERNLQADERRCAVILDQLRSLSGRLALKLVSAPTQQSEVLGLALARLFLDNQGALANQIILSIDTHLELFQAAQKQANESGESVSLQRTDLALFDLSLTTRTIRCNLVEVKCYTQIGSLSSYQKLKEEIIEQISQTEVVLRHHFEQRDRPDELLKVRELSTLLEFYLNRSIRYGLIKPEVAQEAEIFLTTLEQGYRLEFSRSALIFDFSQPGTEPIEEESGVEFHRIGIDLIHTLVKSVESSTTAPSTTDEGTVQSVSLPQLRTAAFLVPTRSYSVTWDSLANRTNQDRLPAGAETQQDLQVSEISDLPDSSSTTAMPPDAIIQSVASPDSTILPQLQTQPDECSYDVILGAEDDSPQFGILGEAAGRKIALDLNQTHTISLFGVQGAGKSYTLGSILEMACLPVPNINKLPSPLATVVFHYSPTEDYKPEFTSMIRPNSNAGQIAALSDRYGAKPSSLRDVVILTSAAKVKQRQAEYPDIQVLPIAFASSELKIPHWKFLMGAIGSQNLYLRQINLIMKNLRDRLTLSGLLEEIERSSLADHLKDLAKARLNFATEYINEQQPLAQIIRPGRLIIVDLRDEFIEKDEALGLFVVMLQIFSDAVHNAHPFNKLIVFDEAHKYVESPDLVSGLVEVVREMRHKGTNLLIASQDPASVPISLIELSSQVILHRFNSPAWLKHLQKAITVLNALTPEKMSQLGSGESYIWSSKASDDSFVKGAIKVHCRPRITQHGGATKTAT